MTSSKKIHDFTSSGIEVLQTSEEFSYTFAIHPQNNNILRLYVKIRNFQLQVTVLNIDKNSPLSRRIETSKGSFGHTYVFSFLDQ